MLISLMAFILNYDLIDEISVIIFISGLPGPCPAGGAHQLAVPLGLIIVIGYQYGMYYTRYQEEQG